ncbi:Putative F-box/LRR-repeat protein At3g18150 [Linum grandiflorum]
MEKHPKKSTAPGRDLISNLPDEIIQSIVCRISCHKQAAQTSALSRRWRDLWCSHAFVKFDSTRGFQEFADSTMKRFSRDKLLRMQTLDISVEPDNDTIRFPPMEKLLDLASKRKAEYVSINIRRDRMRRNLIRLPYELLSNSSAKTLYLRNIRFESNKNGNDLLVRMNSLRSLEMENVAFQEERLFTNLIASSPNLETLELRGIPGMKKFRLSNIPNLKKFSISDLDDVEEIEISASGLLTLYFMCTRVFRIELIAPQLITLEIEHCGLLRLGDVSRVISKLPNLKSLTLYGFSSLAEQKLNLLNPKLEVFELCPPPGLEEIELDVGPNFSKFVLHWNHSSSLDELKKCEIRNAATHCTWEVHVFKPQISQTLQWFAQLKMFIARFPQFHTINIFVAEVGLNISCRSRILSSIYLSAASELPYQITPLGEFDGS